MSLFDQDLYKLARFVQQSGYPKSADKIMRLSNKPAQVVDILKTVFTPGIGEFLGQERANNLAMAVLYYDSKHDLHEYLHDGLIKTNEPFYSAERKNKLSDKKAWDLAEQAIKKLQQKKFLPQDLQ